MLGILGEQWEPNSRYRTGGAILGLKTFIGRKVGPEERRAHLKFVQMIASGPIAQLAEIE
jgi:hypothetical protein